MKYKRNKNKNNISVSSTKHEGCFVLGVGFHHRVVTGGYSIPLYSPARSFEHSDWMFPLVARTIHSRSKGHTQLLRISPVRYVLKLGGIDQVD